MDRLEVVTRLKKKQGKMSLRQFAKAIGISAPYLSDIYKARRLPGPTILKFLGIVKKQTVTYSVYGDAK